MISKRPNSISWVSKSISRLRVVYWNILRWISMQELALFMEYKKQMRNFLKFSHSFNFIDFYGCHFWIFIQWLLRLHNVFFVFKSIHRLRQIYWNKFGRYLRHSEKNFNAGICTSHDKQIEMFSNSQILLHFRWFSWLSLLNLTVTSKRPNNILWVCKSVSRLRLVYWNILRRIPMQEHASVMQY